jgi:hypothetical protein
MPTRPLRSHALLMLWSAALESRGPGPVPPDFTLTEVDSDLGQDHAMVVTRVRDDNGNLDIRLAGHNINRNYLKLTDVFAAYPNLTGSIWLFP